MHCAEYCASLSFDWLELYLSTERWSSLQFYPLWRLVVLWNSIIFMPISEIHRSESHQERKAWIACGLSYPRNNNYLFLQLFCFSNFVLVCIAIYQHADSLVVVKPLNETKKSDTIWLALVNDFVFPSESFLKKPIMDSIDSGAIGLRNFVFDDKNQERKPWICCGKDIPRSHIVFAAQVSFLIISIIFLVSKLPVSETAEQQTLWCALLTSSNASSTVMLQAIYILPNPRPWTKPFQLTNVFLCVWWDQVVQENLDYFTTFWNFPCSNRGKNLSFIFINIANQLTTISKTFVVWLLLPWKV